MTERSRYVFTVKDFEEGHPWIALEPFDKHLSLLRKGFMGLDLKKGTSLKDAQKIASLLNKNVATVSYTGS